MSKIECTIHGAQGHLIQLYLKTAYPETSVERYQTQFPGAALIPPPAIRVRCRPQAAKTACSAGETVMAMAGAAPTEAPAVNVAPLMPKGPIIKQSPHAASGLGAVPAAMHLAGKPIVSAGPTPLPQIDCAVTNGIAQRICV